MSATSATAPVKLGVLLGDPRLPYSFSREGKLGEEELEAARRLESALAQVEGYRVLIFDDHERMLDDLRAARPDLVLNFCDTGYRNNWELAAHIPALLEVLAIPYTGSPPMAMYVSSDKELVRALAVGLGVAVPDQTFVDLSGQPLVVPRSYPALIKPNIGAGSFGITEDCVVRDADEAASYLRWLAGRVTPPQALIQEFLAGAEYTVGVIGNPQTGLMVLPPAELDYSAVDPDLPHLFTYAGKFDPNSRYWKQLRHRRAELDEATRAQLARDCTRLFKRLGFRDYARFDFRVGADGQPRLLDANPNPTWYWDSRMAMMSGWAGYDYPGMLRLILEAAARRYGIDVASDHGTRHAT